MNEPHCAQISQFLRTTLPPLGQRRLLALLALVVTSLAWPLTAQADDEPKNILMIAGRPSHGFGSHEHYAGLKVLEETLAATEPQPNIQVVRGWPDDAKLIEAADTIVIYADGGNGHLAIPHLEALSKKLDQGCGLVCLHYAVEVPKGEPGEAWLKYLGGYFETHWSVNPHWRAHFEALPEHPITRGVEPFSLQDEWYFHMRFTDAPGVTPILQAVAPESTMRRPDGPHSGNPAVRKSVAAGEPQTVAWVFERPDGGRGFGFTGGHFHWNWGNPKVSRLVANAILWSAGAEVPAMGVGAKPLKVERLLEDQDFPKPDNFDAEEVAREYQLSLLNQSQSTTPAKQLYASAEITARTAGHAVEMNVDLQGSRELFLVVTDAGDGFSCDWANWIDPVLVGPTGELSLLELSWKRATTQFGEVRKNANAVGQPISVANREISRPAIGTHANSVIHYSIPAGYQTLRVTGALDSGGTNQNGGNSTSVRFAIYGDAVPPLSVIERQLSGAVRDPANAVAGLEIAPDLEATLSAHEPTIKSLTNLDIDDRGRVWVCDVMNYRGNSGSRPQGDRILILEDTNGDGVMDKVKTFYQGTDIDSAMGICVLGNEVIVSASPYVWRLIDDNGDDVADRKVPLFTQTGQHQHDHSNHSFVFGPDGKLYWNFGNTGQQVKDAQGETVVDIHGRPVVDNGKPFYGGMVFRCDLDGSNFEVVAHNFRNSYELAVDSFGTIWQSDNDDDGNRGTRINFVMEHGNYGYLDELTGAGWRADRINIESEIPLRHWHLNDPGVVPNVLQTGAGSPTGITVYEGGLLPERFRNQMIHCDAGPNVVRAYPTTAAGAGYNATIEPLITAGRDRWFRPVDVCTAPDGSLFVTDWYDSGVGGHRHEDLEGGRLYRIAPPNTPYKVPTFDFSTAQGAVEALRSPTQAVRYKAWMALHHMGQDAEAELQRLFADPDPRLRARALWLLGKLPGRGEHYVQQALADKDADIRITAIRLMRQLELVPAQVLAEIVTDPSPAVRREALVALRYDTSAAMPELWAQLATKHDGQDRWYLEALGIASDLRPSDCYRALERLGGEAIRPTALADILWRLRANEAAEKLVQLIAASRSDLSATDRYFRALEYHPLPLRTRHLTAAFINSQFATAATDEATQSIHDAIIVRSLQRVDSAKLATNEDVEQAVVRHIRSRKGTAEFLQLIKQFRPAGMQQELLQIALGSGDDSASVEAVQLITAEADGKQQLTAALTSADADGAQRLAKRLGLLGTPQALDILTATVGNAEVDYTIRSAAVRGLASSSLGAKRLVEVAGSGNLLSDTRLLAGGLLSKVADAELRGIAATLLPRPAQADARPLPPLDELVAMSGDSQRGRTLFQTKATCSNCHVVDGVGKQVGPDLSEIGTKLSREAMYTSILDPSAGISHNYETYIALLESGQIISGVKVNETEEAVTLRTAEAIDRTLNRDELVELKKSEKSIMPDDLHQTIDQQGLVDVVEYLLTLTAKE